jgi:hypothetical protein
MSPGLRRFAVLYLLTRAVDRPKRFGPLASPRIPPRAVVGEEVGSRHTGDPATRRTHLVRHR